MSVSADTATTADFAAVTDFGITITAGDTSGTATFSLAPVDDSDTEDTETVAVTGTATAAGLTVNGTTVAITDNDKAPTAVSDIPPQRLRTGSDTEIDLGNYFDVAEGEPVTYDATSSDPSVVTVELTVPSSASLARALPVTRVDGGSSVTSTVIPHAMLVAHATGTATISFTATDARGRSAAHEVEVSVVVSLTEPLGRVLEAVLPEDTRTRVDSAASAVAKRVEARRAALAGGTTPRASVNLGPYGPVAAADRAALPSTGSPARPHSLGLFPATDGTAWEVFPEELSPEELSPVQRRSSLEQALRRSSFLLPLGVSESQGGAGIELWGNADYRSLSSNQDGQVDWDGDLMNLHLGADAHIGDNLLAGVSASWSRTRADFTGEGSGTYESDLTGLNPYLGWTSKRTSLWVMGGYGKGEVTVDDGAVTARGDIAQTSAAAGLQRLLYDRGDGTTLKLKGEGLYASVRTAEDGELPELTLDVSRLRLALEGASARDLASGGRIVPAVEVGVRHDAGDGRTGSGVELGASLRYRGPAGLNLEGRGRTLLAGNGRREWGAGARIEFDPGADRQGFTFRLEPVWGDAAGGIERLWENGAPSFAGRPATDWTADPRPRLSTSVGYGHVALGGLFTSYVQYTRDGDTETFGLGERIEAGSGLNLHLRLEHRRRRHDAPDYGASLRLSLRF